MARARADVREAEPFEKRADMALVILNAKARLDDTLEIDAPPAHHAVVFPVGTCFDDRRQFGLLSRRQARRPALRPIVQKPVGAGGVETVNPVAQRLTIHATDAGRVGAAPFRPEPPPAIGAAGLGQSSLAFFARRRSASAE